MQNIMFFREIPSVAANFSIRGQESEAVRRELAEAGLLVVRPLQVHKDRVGCITEDMKLSCIAEGRTELVLEDTDAVITACQDVALTTIHADCLPIWIYDEKSGAMGLAHGGWRGTCAGIGVKMAREMVRLLGASCETMAAAVGPGISRCCFEVGPEVYEAFAEKYDFIDEYAERKESGKFYLDLKEINRRQLADLGIQTIEVSPLCTVCSSVEDAAVSDKPHGDDRQGASGEPLFYSYRRDNGMKGRLVASLYRK